MDVIFGIFSMTHNGCGYVPFVDVRNSLVHFNDSTFTFHLPFVISLFPSSTHAPQHFSQPRGARSFGGGEAQEFFPTATAGKQVETNKQTNKLLQADVKTFDFKWLRGVHRSEQEFTECFWLVKEGLNRCICSLH